MDSVYGVKDGLLSLLPLVIKTNYVPVVMRSFGLGPYS